MYEQVASVERISLFSFLSEWYSISSMHASRVFSPAFATSRSTRALRLLEYSASTSIPKRSSKESVPIVGFSSWTRKASAMARSFM